MPNIFERVIIIILISKDEYKKIREKFPELHIRRTVAQKSKRGRYYMTERRDAMLYLLKDTEASGCMASVCLRISPTISFDGGAHGFFKRTDRERS